MTNEETVKLDRAIGAARSAYERALKYVIERAEQALRRQDYVDPHAAHNLSADVIAVAEAASKWETLTAARNAFTSK